MEIKKTKLKITPRSAFQIVGTDIVRDYLPTVLFGEDNNIGKDFWIKRCDMLIKKTFNDHIIFSDVRFQNEVDYIIKNGGVVIKIVRENAKDNTHSSEEIDKITGYTHLIENNGTKQELYDKLDSFRLRN